MIQKIIAINLKINTAKITNDFQSFPKINYNFHQHDILNTIALFKKSNHKKYMTCHLNNNIIPT